MEEMQQVKADKETTDKLVTINFYNNAVTIAMTDWRVPRTIDIIFLYISSFSPLIILLVVE